MFTQYWKDEGCYEKFNPNGNGMPNFKQCNPKWSTDMFNVQTIFVMPNTSNVGYVSFC